MDPEANRIAQLETARQILRLVDEVVDCTTTAELELYHAAGRLAELVLAAHNWRTLLDQGYVSVDDPDSGLVTLTEF